MTSCTRCGTALSPDDDFCTQCAEPAVGSPLRTRRRAAAPAFVVGVIALLVAGGATAWYVLAQRAEVSASAAEGETSPSPGVPTRPPSTGSGPAPSAEPATLATQVEADRPTAEGTVGYWIPQISSKSVGMQVGSAVYDPGRILDEFREANRTYDAFLVRSDDYSTFQRSGYWVTLVPQRFTDARGAVSWCVDHGFTPDGCFAKRLSHTEAPDGNTLHWNR